MARGLLVAATLLLLSVTACSSSGGEAPSKSNLVSYPAAERKRVEPLSGDSLTAPGTTLSSDGYPGEVVVINLWGSWCGPCRFEATDLEKVAAETESCTQFLGVNLRDDVRSHAEDFVRDRGVTYPSIYDPPGRTLLKLNEFPRASVPATYVLDRQHRVAAIFFGALLASDLKPVLDSVCAEPKA